MKKANNIVKLAITAMVFAATAATNAQLLDQKDVTISMELQPVLELEMDTPDQLDFIFDEIHEYRAGIIKYAATTLKVSATVSWDLYAVGRSAGMTGFRFWDQHASYNGGAAITNNAISEIPLTALELRQSHPNPGMTNASPDNIASDYSTPFTTNYDFGASGANSIFVNAAFDGTSSFDFISGGGNAAPDNGGKYIAGHSGTGDYVVGGTYLENTGLSSNYYYAIDYRILPGLPVIFPMAFNSQHGTAEDIASTSGGLDGSGTPTPSEPTYGEEVAGAYAEPGSYTMYVEYILLEDQ